MDEVHKDASIEDAGDPLAPPGGGHSNGSTPVRSAFAATVYTVVDRAVLSGSRIVLFACVARFYSMDDAGNFAYLIFLGTLFAMVSDLGLTGFLNREIPGSGFGLLPQEVKSIHVRMGGAPFAVFLSWLLAWSLDPALGLSSIGALALAVALNGSQFLAAIHRGHGFFKNAAFESGYVASVSVAAALSAGFSGWSFSEFQIAVGLSSSSMVLLRFLIVRSRKRQQMMEDQEKQDPVSLCKLFSRSQWFLLGSTVAWLRFETGVALLKLLSREAAAALFASALKSAGILSQALHVFCLVFMPSMAYSYHKDRDRFAGEVDRFLLLLLVFVPFGYAACRLGGKWMLMFFGEPYLLAEPILDVMAIGIIVQMAFIPPHPLLAMKKERAAILVSVAQFGVFCFIAYLIVPSLGAMGAALAFLLSAGFSKVFLAICYVSYSVSFGRSSHLIVSLLLGVWLLAIRLAPAMLENVFLGIGGVLGAVVSIYLLRRTHLF